MRDTPAVWFAVMAIGVACVVAALLLAWAHDAKQPCLPHAPVLGQHNGVCP